MRFVGRIVGWGCIVLRYVHLVSPVGSHLHAEWTRFANPSALNVSFPPRRFAQFPSHFGISEAPSLSTIENITTAMYEYIREPVSEID